jgi:glutamate formiminotransferase/formiminotetrahydrofolate cyclodeaminase
VASITDAAVGAQMAYTGVRGGIWNVIINLKDITDEAYVADMQQECSSLLAQAGEKLNEITAYIDQKLLDRLAKARKL